MFMISATAALSSLGALYFALSTLVDGRHRIRTDRLDSEKPLFYRVMDRMWATLESWVCCGRERGTEEEREGLLGGEGHGNGGHGSNGGVVNHGATSSGR